MDFDEDRLDDAGRDLGTRDRLFLKRIFAGGLDRYRDRLRAIGFDRLASVLDAGCGFGQWTFALAETAGTVGGVDNDATRVRTAERLADGCPHVTFRTASLEALPFPDESFDGVFCYSAIYYTDVVRSVRELIRVLRPGGLLYICSNGPGWYLHNLIKAPHASSDFRPRRYAVATGLCTCRYRLFRTPPGNAGSVITPRRWLARRLVEHGIEVIGVGDEGTVAVPGADRPRSFFRGRYYGLEGVSEWLGRRRAGSVAGAAS